MSALIEIEMAIATLRKLRDASSPDPWVKVDVGGGGFISTPGRHLDIETEVEADTDLIIVLRHTIDAQIDVLRRERAFMLMEHHTQSVGPPLDLARAINGTTTHRKGM